MLLPPEKHFEISKKFEQKFMRLHIKILVPTSSFAQKNDILCDMREKDKKRHVHENYPLPKHYRP
jgi:hypothetical protein